MADKRQNLCLSEMATDAQQNLIRAITEALRRDSRILAAWLAGSLGRDAGDDFSDVDVLVLCQDGKANEISTAPRLLDFASPVQLNALYGGRILNVITPTWQRFDLVFVEAQDLARYNANDLKPLFNRGASEPPRVERRAHRATPDDLSKLVNEFFRVFTLAPVGLGRREYIVMLSGIELLRKMTADLMLMENGVGQRERGGALRLNPFLSSEQLQLLESLPAVAAERDRLLRCQKAIADIFVPRARVLAAHVGMTWPTALEEASRAHLKSQLGIEF